mmetsp:Transcript_5499/g.16282  ORF Transcript_5499/g.16282 Transcript_5499/m.16282 type:complete len:446 (+) Transcript_5499:1139-2476(+)
MLVEHFERYARWFFFDIGLLGFLLRRRFAAIHKNAPGVSAQLGGIDDTTDFVNSQHSHNRVGGTHDCRRVPGLDTRKSLHSTDVDFQQVLAKVPARIDDVKAAVGVLQFDFPFSNDVQRGPCFASALHQPRARFQRLIGDFGCQRGQRLWRKIRHLNELDCGQLAFIFTLHGQFRKIANHLFERILVDGQYHALRLGDAICGSRFVGDQRTFTEVVTRRFQHGVFVIPRSDGDVGNADGPLLQDVEHHIIRIALLHQHLAFLEESRDHRVDQFLDVGWIQGLEEADVLEQPHFVLLALQRLGLQDIPERLLVDAVQAGGDLGNGAGGTRAGVQQRQFAEAVSGLRRAHRLLVDLEPHLAFLDDVEVIPVIALLDDRRVHLDVDQLEGVDHGLELLLGQIREDEVVVERGLEEGLFGLVLWKIGSLEGLHVHERRHEDVLQVMRSL